jgi:hypothetical protein
MANLSSFYPQPVIAGTTEGTFAEGDDARIVGALPAATAGTGSVLASGSNTTRTLSDRFADVVNVKDFGAVGDGKVVFGGGIESGTNTLTVGGASFNSSDVGKHIVIEGAASSKHSLFTTISSVTSATQVVLSANASATVSNRRVVYGNDDSDAIRAAASYAVNNGLTLFFPNATYLLMKLHNNNTQTNLMTPGQSGNFIHYLNPTTSTPKTFKIIGDQSTLLSPLYPTTNGSQIGNVYWISVDGRWENCVIDGLRFKCTHPFVESRVRGEAGYFTIGNTTAIFAYWDGFGNATIDGLNRPRNLTVQNCASEDFNHFLNAWACDGLLIKNNNIIAEYGYASTGNGDEVNQSITTRFACQNVVVDSNYFCGMTANDVTGITMAPSSWDGLVTAQDGLFFGLASKNVSITNNFLYRFGYEGFAVGFGTGSFGAMTWDNRGRAIFSNNFINNELPVGHALRNDVAIAVTHDDFLICNNYITNSSTAIKTVFSTFNENSIISENYIVLAPYNSVGFNGARGIVCDSSNNTTIQNNYIVGYNVGSFEQRGWDGNGPVASGDDIVVTTGIQVTGGVGATTASASKVYIKNNFLTIASRATQSPTPIAVAFLVGAQNGAMYFDGNIVKNFDFAVHRYGGNQIIPHFKNLIFEGGKRLISRYVFNSVSKFYNFIHTIRPTQTGWYKCVVEFGRRTASGKISINISGETRYGDTRVTDQTSGYQQTVFEFSAFTQASTGRVLALNQTNHASGTNPAITKAYLTEEYNAPYVYLYVNRVTDKLALTFSGGGAVAPNIAVGYANVVNGVITSVTVTSAGSGYTSAPTVSITNSLNSFISGSGATFTAVLSGDTIGGVTVGGEGGNGYSQPINIKVEHPESDEIDYSIYGIEYSASSPAGGIDLNFSNGAKSIQQTGGSGAAIRGTGNLITSTTVPASHPTNSVPEFIGQQYVNTASGIAYIATGTSSSSDWKALATWNP